MSVARRRFRIIKEIAEGGFGKVYLAEQISSDGFSRIVAVKLLHAKWSSHDEVVMRTRDEARLLGLIRHQHIVKVEDLTAIDGKCAIVMEYLEGVDLKWMMQYLKERELDFPRSALFEIMLSTASALDAAYNGLPLQGGEPLRVIHRDIKPSNIFVTVAGGMKVLDFGTARANFAQREAKTQALAFGSQGYMAPERMLGEEDTPAADIFSLGITLYELLSSESFGRIPPRPNKFAAKVEEKIASVPLQGDEEWCEQVRETLRLMMAYEPGDRPTAAQVVEIMEVLSQYADDMPLRRFCRTLVAEAKANEPELDTGDPLAGTIVDEDASAGFGLGAGGVPEPVADAGQSDLGGPPPPPDGLGAMSLGLAPPPDAGAAPAAPPATPQPEPAPAPAPKPAPAPRSAPPAEEEGGGGFFGIIVALVGGGGLVVIGVLVLLILAVVAVIAMQGGGSSTPAPEPTVKASKGKKAKGKKAKAAASKVISPWSGDAKKALPTTLKFVGAGEAEFKIRGPGGFSAEWDGSSDFDIGKVGAGRYATAIKVGGKSIRGKSFTVPEPDRKTKQCTFTFKAKAKDWSTECGK